jgi:hypothetical protein
MHPLRSNSTTGINIGVSITRDRVMFALALDNGSFLINQTLYCIIYIFLKTLSYHYNNTAPKKLCNVYLPIVRLAG